MSIETTGMGEIMPQEVTIKEDGGEFIGMMERLASNKDVDVAKIEKMIDLHERMLNRNAKSEFAVDFVRMKPHLPRVVTTHTNTQTKSKYAKLEDINKTVDPILSEYGFATGTKVVLQNLEGVTVKAELWHKGGHIEETTVYMPIDDRGLAGTVNKTNAHATKSSITYAKNTAICTLLNISTGDDTDGNVGAVDSGQAAEIDHLINTTKANRAAFLTRFRITDVRDLSLNDYGTALKLLNQKKQSMKKESKNED